MIKNKICKKNDGAYGLTPYTFNIPTTSEIYNENPYSYLSSINVPLEFQKNQDYTPTPDASISIPFITDELYLAIEYGSQDYVKKILLDESFDINLINKDGNTPLHLLLEKFRYASKHKKPSIESNIKLLLDKRPNINIINNKGETPLIISCLNGNRDIVVLLLNKDANINKITDGYVYNALIASIYSRNIDIVRLLISFGADPNMTNKFGHTPLFDMISSKSDHVDLEIAKFLIKSGAQTDIIDIYNRNILIAPVRLYKIEFVKLFLNSGANINQEDEWGYTVLMYINKIDIIDTNYDKVFEMTKNLLESGADIYFINKYGKSVIDYCDGVFCNIISKIKGETIEDLKNKAPINGNNSLKKLRNAIENNDIENIKNILDNDSSINLDSSLLNLVCSKASKKNILNIIKLLVEKGTNVNYIENPKYPDFMSSLQYSKLSITYAIKYEFNVEVIKYLLEKGGIVTDYTILVIIGRMFTLDFFKFSEYLVLCLKYVNFRNTPLTSLFILWTLYIAISDGYNYIYTRYLTQDTYNYIYERIKEIVIKEAVIRDINIYENADEIISCPICYIDYSDDNSDDCIVLLCGHSLHKNCAEQWFNRTFQYPGDERIYHVNPDDYKCPVCNTEINPTTYPYAREYEISGGLGYINAPQKFPPHVSCKEYKNIVETWKRYKSLDNLSSKPYEDPDVVYLNRDNGFKRKSKIKSLRKSKRKSVRKSKRKIVRKSKSLRKSKRKSVRKSKRKK